MDDLLPNQAMVRPAQHVPLPRWLAGTSTDLPDCAQPKYLQVHNAGLYFTDHVDIQTAQTSSAAHRMWSPTGLWILRIGDFT